jgi:hypothetical protein
MLKYDFHINFYLIHLHEKIKLKFFDNSGVSKKKKKS